MLPFAVVNIYPETFKEELTFRILTCRQLLIRGVYITRIFGRTNVKKAGLLLG
jgi:hypothetical protein